MPETDLSAPSRTQAADKPRPEELGRAEIGLDEESPDPLDFIEPDGEIEPALVATEDDELLILSPLSDEFDEKVQEAQEQLLHLRHQQEQLEKQKAELEDLKRRREKFLRGRAEATERLTKASSMLEREMLEAQKRVEQFAATRQSFEKHLEALGAIYPEEWSRDEMRCELTRALGAIEEAREEYTSEMARVSSLVSKLPPAEVPVAPIPVEVAAEEDGEENPGLASRTKPGRAVHQQAEVRDFMYWLKSGFAFTLPLLIFGIFALFLVLIIL